MKVLLAVVLTAAGVTASILAAGMIAAIYQELAGVQPEVLGFEDIRDLTVAQERFQLMLAALTFFAGLYLTLKLDRAVLQR